MNNDLNNALINNLERSKIEFVKEFKQNNDLKFKEEMINIDAKSGSLYVSSRFQDLPEILIQDFNNAIMLSYSNERTSETFSFLVDKKNIFIEALENDHSLKIKTIDQNYTIQFYDEKLLYLVFSFINYAILKMSRIIVQS